MTEDERRRRHAALRLAAEIEADRAVLDRLALECEELRARVAPADRAVLALAALDLHGYYTAVENVLERVERHFGVAPPAGPSWHRDLLRGAALDVHDVRPALLRNETVRSLERLLSFRHFIRHAYAADLLPERLGALLDDLGVVHPRLVEDLACIAALLRTLADAAFPT